MTKSPDAFRSIGEVSRLVGVAPHVLRYWESQFSQLSPVKRSDGRRYYRPDDVRLVAGLCQVMREEGMSIRGAKRLIAADRGDGLRQIGAMRLGEALGDASTDMPGGPAVRLAVPEPAGAPGTEAFAQPEFEFAEAAVAVIVPAPAPVAPPEPVLPSIEPRTDAGVWLRRLTVVAAALRNGRASPLPPQLATVLRTTPTGRR